MGVHTLTSYVNKLLEYPRIILAFLLNTIIYLTIPNKSYENILLALILAILLDLITKQYSIIKYSGGYLNAVKSRQLLSNTAWLGTKNKVYSYFIVAILVGVANRAYPLYAIQQAGQWVYLIMLLREFESIVENLVDSGAELKWLLNLLQLKIKKLIKQKEDEIDE